MIHLGEKLRLRVELRQQIAYASKWFCYFLSHLINSFQILLAQSSLTAMPADYASYLTVAKSSLYFAKLSQIFQLHNTIAQLSPIIDNKRQQSAPIGTNRHQSPIIASFLLWLFALTHGPLWYRCLRHIFVAVENSFSRPMPIISQFIFNFAERKSPTASHFVFLLHNFFNFSQLWF